MSSSLAILFRKSRVILKTSSTALCHKARICLDRRTLSKEVTSSIFGMCQPTTRLSRKQSKPSLKPLRRTWQLSRRLYRSTMTTYSFWTKRSELKSSWRKSLLTEMSSKLKSISITRLSGILESICLSKSEWTCSWSHVMNSIISYVRNVKNWSMIFCKLSTNTCSSRSPQVSLKKSNRLKMRRRTRQRTQTC